MLNYNFTVYITLLFSCLREYLFMNTAFAHCVNKVYADDILLPINCITDSLKTAKICTESDTCN